MKAIKLTDKVYWVGAIDWAIRDFHGYATNRGTTYNAYLIIDEKVTLIDTVKKPFMQNLIDRISSIIDPSKIDYIISNHAEMDHSGSLPEMIDLIKPEKVFASTMGVKALEGHFHNELEIIPFKTGDELNIGQMNLSFIETKMLHWPDSMFTYLKEKQLLFSQDAFGMHLASKNILDVDIPDYLLEWEAEKYFANILMPYSDRILKLLDQVAEMNLPIKMIATDHGPIWTEKIPKILDLYRKWSEHKPEPKAVVVYDTMWGATAKMAEAVGEGISDSGVKLKVLPMGSSHRSDVATEILNASALVVGSPTLNNNIFPTLADVLIYLRGLKPINLIGAAFGSYGWSGEALKHLNGYLTDMGVELLSEGFRCKYTPTKEDIQKCYELGQDIAAKLKEKCQ